MQNRLVSRPVWDWGEQFADKDLALFTNPLYKKPPEQQSSARRSMAVVLPPSAVPLPGLHKPVNSRFSVNFPSPAHQHKSIPEVRTKSNQVKRIIHQIKINCFINLFHCIHSFWRFAFWHHKRPFVIWKFGCSAIIDGCQYLKSVTVAIHKSISSIEWYWAVFRSFSKICRWDHSTIQIHQSPHQPNRMIIWYKTCRWSAHFFHSHATPLIQTNWLTFWHQAMICLPRDPFLMDYLFNKRAIKPTIPYLLQ